MDKKEILPRDTLGIMIKEAREDKKLDYIKLADLMRKLNVDEKKISNWEKGYNFPNLDQIYKLAEILELNPTEMLEIRNKIQNSNLKPPNEAARRVGGKLLKFAEPGYNVVRTIIEVLIFACILMLFKFIFASYESMDTPIVYQVENTLDNALELNDSIRKDNNEYKTNNVNNPD